jgi:hypothetical protein
LTSHIVAFEGFINSDNDAVMGFKLTDETGEVYDLGTTSLEQGAASTGKEAINGAVVGMDANLTGFFMYFGFRLEYHDYVNGLEETANLYA